MCLQLIRDTPAFCGRTSMAKKEPSGMVDNLGSFGCRKRVISNKGAELYVADEQSLMGQRLGR
jgi:hypothetical protein